MDAEWDSVAEALQLRRRELSAELDRLTAPPEHDASVSYGKRVGDGTTEAVERISTTAMARSLSGSVSDIDHALAKIKAGTYGLCDSCERRISKARLDALPASRLCMDCAAGDRGLGLST